MEEQTIKLTQMDIKCQFSSETRDRNLIIFDGTGSAEVFFSYKAHLVDVGKLLVALQTGKKTKEEVIETIRKSLVYCMKAGERMVLNCGKIAPDFTGLLNTAGSFPSDLVFNRQEWKKEANYMKVVRDDENIDLMGNRNCYMMNSRFYIVVL